MYEEIIKKWFEKRESPNHQFSIYDLTILLQGYYNEWYENLNIQQEAELVVKALKELGYNKTSKKFVFQKGKELPCYFNISLRKIKELLSNIEDLNISGHLHGPIELYKIGWLLRLHDKGFEIKKINQKGDL